MIRILLAGVAGGVIVYAWSMASYSLLPWHKVTTHAFNDETVVADFFRGQSLPSGVYILPKSPHPEPSAEVLLADEWSDFLDRHRKGPLAFVVIQAHGAEPMGYDVLFGGLAIDVVAGLITASIMSIAGTRPYVHRVAVVALCGLFAGVVGQISYWNWTRFPLDYSMAMAGDLVIGWTLAGLAQAVIIQVRATPPRALSRAAKPTR